MAKKTPEEKLVDQMREALDNYWFNPALFADLLVDENLYYQDKVVELIKYIVQHQHHLYLKLFEVGVTTDNLTTSSYIYEVLVNRATSLGQTNI